MKTFINRLYKVTIVSIAALTVATGCIDEDYDLRKIDKEMQISIPSLSAPFLSGEKFYVSDLINLEDNNYVRTDSLGNYIFKISGGHSRFEYTVEPFTVTPKAYEKAIRNIPTDTYDTEVEMYHTFEINSSDVPQEVQSIERLDFDGTITTQFSFQGNSNIRRIIMKAGTKIVFPSWVEIKDYDHNMLSLGRNNTFTVKNDVPVTSKGINSTIKVSGIDFKSLPKNNGYSDGSIHLSGTFKTNGHFVLMDEDIIKKGSDTSYDVNFKCDFAKTTITGGIFGIRSSIDLEPKTMTALQGIDNTINLEGNYNLDNVYVDLTLENDSPFSAIFAADFSGIAGDRITTSSIRGINIHNESTENFIISDKDGTFVHGMTDLINSKPEMIRLENTTIEATGESCSIKTGTPYAFNMNYSIEAPLAFAKDLSVSSTKTFDINLDLGETEIESVEFSFTAENSIPLGIQVTAAVKAEDSGRSTSGPATKVTMNHGIEPGTIENPSVSPVTVSIFPEKGKKIANLTLSFTLYNDEAHASMPLNMNQMLSLKDIKLKANGINVQL